MMAAASAPRSSVSSSRLNRVSDVGFADLQWMTRVQFPPSNKTTTGLQIGQSRLNLAHFSSLTPSPTTATRLHHHSRQSVSDSVSVGLPLGRSKDDLATIGSGGSNCVSDVNCEYFERQWKHRMRINVSGQMYETRSTVFDARPGTLLGNPALRKPYWDDKRQEYFFDRHRPSFEVIFTHYVEGGRLVRPNDIPFEVFMDEVLFYNMEPEIIAQLKQLEGITDDERLMPEGKIQKALWALFEYPETSTAAFIIALISVSLTLVAIFMLCIETLPQFADGQQCDPEEDDDGFLIDDGDSRTASSSQLPSSSSVDTFFVVETVCTSWFTIELLIRFVVCPSKLLFWKDFKNLIDVASILPFYVDLLLQQGKTACVTAVNAPSSSSPSLSYLRVFRLARVFKLTKHCVGLQVLIETFKASLEGLSMFMLTLSFCVLVYSSALYYAELNVPGAKVNSIPDAFWWALITMTTVGYGDVYPVGVAGRVVGTACAVSGILTLAIPVPIIAGHFNRFYSSMTGHHHHNQM